MIDDPTGNILPHRFDPPKAIIIHCSGDTDERKVREYYHKNDENVCPHFFINSLGETFKIADPVSQTAYHCAMSKAEAALYAQGQMTWQRYTVKNHKDGPVSCPDGVDLYKYWRDTWGIRGLPSPLGMGLGRPNFNTVGIELLSLDKPTNAVFNGAQYEALAVLLNTLTRQFNLPVTREYILGHSDVNPLARPGNDPGLKFDWDGLFKTVMSMGPQR